MKIEQNFKEIEQTETGFEYGIMHKYNIISSGDNIQYIIKPNFNYTDK